MAQQAIEHGTSRSGRWLRTRRLRIALAIAGAEGIVVALREDVSRVTVIVVAGVFLAFYVFAGRKVRSDAGRQLSWIAGASQALAVIAAVLAFILSWLALILVAIFALVVLFFLFTDRQ